jgi:hypothetical protein
LREDSATLQPVLIFIDESGDSGLKLSEGSSRYLVVALVVFEDREEAVACDQRIELLRRELGWHGEFHFYRNSHRARQNFLRAVAPYNFFYYGIVIDKAHITEETFPDKHSFYKYTCGLVFERAKDKLRNATVVIDGTGSIAFRRELASYIKNQCNKKDETRLIKKVKVQHSRGNNLLQLADYIAGIINRSMQDEKKFTEEYRALIGHREIDVSVWPH